jgi:hypothetical protein
MNRQLLVLLAMAAILPRSSLAQKVPVIPWAPHDTTRPLPPVVRPPPGPAPPVEPPSDAIVLFSGTDVSAWLGADSGAVKWIVAGGMLEVLPHSGDIHTILGFGDCQLHLEWATPTPPQGRDQERGNSGVYLMGLYEIQVLDSYQNQTYADGMAGAVYGQYPPLVNVSRPPGEWQTYDIIFRRPRFGADGKIREPAYVTLLHNGVLVQDHVALTGPTAHRARPPYHAHADRLPLKLQDHGVPVRFRNIWIRDLAR